MLLISAGLILFLLGENACQKEPFSQGKYLYEVHCQNCHMKNGQGLGQEIPSLRAAVSKPKKWACLIRHGKTEMVSKDGVSYRRVMPANPQLSVAEINNILNYIQNQWVEKSEFAALDSVLIWLDNCPKN